MVRSSALLTAVLPLAAAFPWAMDASHAMDVQRLAERRQARYASSSGQPDEGTIPPVREPTFLTGRSNSGLGHPNTPFNAEEQYVDVTRGSGHEYIAPGPRDLRGQCPGLNAAANHGFLKRNGIPTIANTVSGLREAYNMNEDLSLALAVISVALAGDIVTQTWSIGGEYSPALPLGGLLGLGSLLGKPRGIIGTHNKYEGDASIVRGDAYLNGGQQVFQLRSWNRLYPLAASEGGLTMDKVAKHNDYTHGWSILNNPYFFSAPFSGLVTVAAHNFVVAFMSNHSEEAPGGYLDGEVLKCFFGVTGEPGNFKYNFGQERIPENWYKRAGGLSSYTLPDVALDGLTNNAMYPGLISIGGNTGTVDSFTGVDTGDLTGGLFTVGNLAEGNNAACFLLQMSQAGLADQLTGLLSVVGNVLSFVTEKLGPLEKSLKCPQLGHLRNELLQKYPGSAQYFQG
ncbi:uncharacterized protein RCC_03241 [Ramularia collo-cygni]|uniref:Heme haloperoxidase family profile domain-containing protein n=1 Tax=Ramularia collo-cygni TaxID=112498 RepID=A0A2D3UYK4_9PEZI|nr:uncharacterized protein RCC_03241 [Ramularia collo-cygni]CZT17407.1 uncharacterized protein RCC_03241 [Ramularia collo-cygni]